jgi:hypothetical protein
MLELVCRIGEMIENKGGEISEQSRRKLDRFVLANPMVSTNLTKVNTGAAGPGTARCVDSYSDAN